MAYSLSESGSDWIRWKVREIATGKDLDDEVRWSKFSGAAWLHDGSGFFYSRYDAPKEGEALTGVNKNQKVYFHKLGTPQDADVLDLRASRSARLGPRRRRHRRRQVPADLPERRHRPEEPHLREGPHPPRQQGRAVPQRLRRHVQHRRQRWRDVLRAHQPGRAAQAAGRDHARPGIGLRMEDADCRRPEAGRAGRRDDGRRTSSSPPGRSTRRTSCVSTGSTAP